MKELHKYLFEWYVYICFGMERITLMNFELFIQDLYICFHIAVLINGNAQNFPVLFLHDMISAWQHSLLNG